MDSALSCTPACHDWPTLSSSCATRHCARGAGRVYPQIALRGRVHPVGTEAFARRLHSPASTSMAPAPARLGPASGLAARLRGRCLHVASLRCRDEPGTGLLPLSVTTLCGPSDRRGMELSVGKPVQLGERLVVAASRRDASRLRLRRDSSRRSPGRASEV